MKTFFALLTLTLSSGLISCSSFKSTMKKVGDPVASLAKTNLQRLKDLPLPGRSDQNSRVPPVVKVRRDDLREVQFGREKVLAWTRSREQGGGTVYLPLDFDLSQLSTDGPRPSSGILPPMGSNDSESEAPDSEEIPDLSFSDFQDDNER